MLLGAVPMFGDLITGAPLSSGVAVGVTTALIGLMITTFDPNMGDRVKAGILLGLASGLCFGTGLLLMAQTTVDGGLWPVVAQRSTALIILFDFAQCEVYPNRDGPSPPLFCSCRSARFGWSALLHSRLSKRINHSGSSCGICVPHSNCDLVCHVRRRLIEMVANYWN